MEKNNSIYAKLLEVQKEVAPIKKTEANPFFHSSYFDVNGILAALKPILNKHGLVLTQGIRAMEGKNILVTEVADVDSKEDVESSIYLPENLDPQKMGSAITYFRRYALQSLFALEAVDDDGNVASQPAGAKALPAKKKFSDDARSSAENDLGYETI